MFSCDKMRGIINTLVLTSLICLVGSLPVNAQELQITAQGQTMFCDGDSVVLVASQGFKSYL